MLNTILPPGQRKDQGITQDLFGMSNLEAALFNPFWGSGKFENCLSDPDGGYTLSTIAGSPTLTSVAGRHGIWRLDTGSTTATHGAGLQFGAGWLQQSSGSDVMFETLIRLNGTSTEPAVLVGLAEDDATVLSTAGAVAVDDFIGFFMDGADTNIDWIVRVGGSSNVLSTSISSYTDATWLHLGLQIIDGKQFVPWINHVRMDSYIVTNSAYVPTEELSPTFAIVGKGTTQPTMDIDWWLACDNYRADVRS